LPLFIKDRTSGGDGQALSLKAVEISGLRLSLAGFVSFAFAHLTSLKSDKKESHRSHNQAVRGKN
jgi:hypothetical protein